MFTKIKGTVLGPYTKDHRTLGSIFGSPDLRAVTHACPACTFCHVVAIREEAGIVAVVCRLVTPPQKLHEGCPKLGVHVWSPYVKDYSILGSMLGSPYFGKLPHWV